MTVVISWFFILSAVFCILAVLTFWHLLFICVFQFSPALSAVEGCFRGEILVF
jgi:hypothetical protein